MKSAILFNRILALITSLLRSIFLPSPLHYTWNYVQKIWISWRSHILFTKWWNTKTWRYKLLPTKFSMAKGWIEYQLLWRSGSVEERWKLVSGLLIPGTKLVPILVELEFYLILYLQDEVVWWLSWSSEIERYCAPTSPTWLSG